MPTAPELLRLDDFTWLWQVYDPAVKSDLFSTALRGRDGFLLVDPTSLEREALEEMLAGLPVAGVVVTNANHPRAASVLAKRFAVPLYAAGPFPELSAASLVQVADGAEIAPDIRAIALPGAAPGEIALHFAHAEGTLVVGDALINFEPYGFTLLPPKYCTDQKELRRSLKKLLDWPFERLLFAHGSPILSSARQRLETLLS